MQFSQFNGTTINTEAILATAAITTGNIEALLDGFDFGTFDRTFKPPATRFASAAEAWLGLGFTTIPGTSTKAPLVKFVEELVDVEGIVHRHWAEGKARPDAEKILGWDEWYEDATPLLLLDSGEFFRLVVVDADIAGLEPWIEKTFGKTPFVVSSGRAEGVGHYYYLMPLDTEMPHSANGMIGPAESFKPSGSGRSFIDVKGWHSYCVSPGAKHKSGRVYTVKDIPDWQTTCTVDWFLKNVPVFPVDVFERCKSEFVALKASMKIDVVSTTETDDVSETPSPDAETSPADRVTVPVAAVEDEEVEPFTAWCKSNPSKVTLELWWALATNFVAAYGAEGREKFHDISRLDGRYVEKDCEYTWERALKSKPTTYATLVKRGYDGAVPEKITAPCVLLRLEALNDRYIYVCERDKVFDRVLDRDYTPTGFSRLGSAERQWMSPGYDLRRSQAHGVTFNASGIVRSDLLNLFDRRRMRNPKSKDVPCPSELWLLVLNLAGGREVEANYLLDSLSFRLRFPSRPQVAVVLTGTTGTGKGTFAKVAQLHCDPYVGLLDLSIIESGWGNHMVHTILVVAEEISADHMKDARRTAEMLKSQIFASERRSFNTKYGKLQNITASAGWLILSNHDLAVALAQNDRRYTFISSQTKLDPVLGARLNNELLHDAAWLQKVTDHLYSRDLSGFEPMTPLDNEARRAALRASRPPILVWCDDVVEGMSNVVKPGKEYSTGALYAEFADWCRTKGIKDPMTEIGFGRLVPKEWTACRVGRKSGSVDERKAGHRVPGIAAGPADQHGSTDPVGNFDLTALD